MDNTVYGKKIFDLKLWSNSSLLIWAPLNKKKKILGRQIQLHTKKKNTNDNN